jgi:hypothetical protein
LVGVIFQTSNRYLTAITFLKKKRVTPSPACKHPRELGVVPLRRYKVMPLIPDNTLQACKPANQTPGNTLPANNVLP